MSRIIARRAAALAALAFFVTACGVTDPGGMSQAEADVMTQQIAGAAGESLSGLAAAASAQGTSSAVSLGLAVLINQSFSARTNCTAGGHMEVSGNWSGNISETGSGALLLEAQQTISDWSCVSDYVFNGDPYLSLTGTFSFLNGNLNSPASMSMGGGFRWGTGSGQSCQIRLTFLIYADGHGTISGQVCGRNVNVSVS